MTPPPSGARPSAPAQRHQAPIAVRPRTPKQRGNARRSLRWVAEAALVIAAAITLVAVGIEPKTISGQAVSTLYDPFKVGGLAATEGPSGPRAGAPAPTGVVENTDGGDLDALALSAVNDVEQFWRDNYQGLDGAFRPVQRLLSYDSTDPDTPDICGSDPYQVPNAFYCHRDRLIAWDRAVMLPIGVRYFGPMSVVALVAHEYGHALQRMATLVNRRTPTVVFEQKADCFAGTYLRWVAEGHSPRFTLSTGDGLNFVLAATIAIRDPLITPKRAELLEDGHGTALDRITALQMGFTTGASACTAITLDDVDKRRGELPIALLPDETGVLPTGEAPITEQTLATLMELLNEVFASARAPQLSARPADCPDAAPSPGATYCPATNTIAVDLAELQQMGAAADESDGVLLQGDNTALSVVTSRYMLALQHQRGLALDTATAAMRTACLTGAATREMAEPIPLSSGNRLQLSAGDVDEAVAGLLTNGVAAGDVRGETVPAGFTRITAFRAGLLSDADRCFELFADEADAAAQRP